MADWYIAARCVAAWQTGIYLMGAMRPLTSVDEGRQMKITVASHACVTEVCEDVRIDICVWTGSKTFIQACVGQWAAAHAHVCACA